MGQRVVVDLLPPLPMLGLWEGWSYSSPPLPDGKGVRRQVGVGGWLRTRIRCETRPFPSEEGWQLERGRVATGARKGGNWSEEGWQLERGRVATSARKGGNWNEEGWQLEARKGGNWGEEGWQLYSVHQYNS